MLAEELSDRRKACDTLAYSLAAFDIMPSIKIALTGSLKKVNRFFRIFNLQFRFRYYRTPAVGERSKALRETGASNLKATFRSRFMFPTFDDSVIGVEGPALKATSHFKP